MRLRLALLFSLLSSFSYPQELKFSFHFQASFAEVADRYFPKKLQFNPVSDIFFSTEYSVDAHNVVSCILGYKNSETFQYRGPEIGIYYNRFLNSHNLYGLLGIKAFVTIHEKYNSHTITFASLGFGYNIVPAISVECIYNKPLKEKFFGSADLSSKIYNEFNFGFALRLNELNKPH